MVSFNNSNNSIDYSNSNNRKNNKVSIINKKNIYSFLIIVFIISIFSSSHLKVNAYNSVNNNNNKLIIEETSIQQQKQQLNEQQQDEQLQQFSKIKIINTVIESDGVDIIFNKSVSFKNLPYLSVSEYITIPVGLLYIDLYDSQTKKLLEFKRFQIENDTDYTLITTGLFNKTKYINNNKEVQQQKQQLQDDKQSQSQPQQIIDYNNNEGDDEEDSTFSITILSDNFNFPTIKKRTTLRFIHCSPDFENHMGVDFSLVNAATLFSNIKYIGDRNHMKSKSFGSSTNFISIPKNNPYQVFIHETDNPKNQLTNPENLHPAYDNPCTISFLLIGSINNPKYPLQIFSITYPLPSTHASQFSEKQHLLSNNYHLNNHLRYNSNQQQSNNNNINMIPSSSSTTPSTPTFLKFFVAVLSFVLLALLSVV